MTKRENYHHGDLAAALLAAVDDLATKFGLESVSLRAVAKKVGVSPAAAFRHYRDKRALLTAFAAQGLDQMATAMETSRANAAQRGQDPFMAVGLAYVRFSLEHPALFQVMWRKELIDGNDPVYAAATKVMSQHLSSGFVDTIPDDDAQSLSPQELLAWSGVHGLASLMIDGPIGQGMSTDEKLSMAGGMLRQMNFQRPSEA